MADSSGGEKEAALKEEPAGAKNDPLEPEGVDDAPESEGDGKDDTTPTESPGDTVAKESPVAPDVAAAVRLVVHTRHNYPRTELENLPVLFVSTVG